MVVVKLRVMKIEDVPFVIMVRNLSREMLHDNREFTIEQGLEWFSKNNPPFFIIEDNGISVGYIRTSNWDEENATAYIGADIAPEHRRKGYAYKAYKLMLDAMFSSGMKEVMLEVLSTNAPAMALYTKLGFQTTRHVEKMSTRDGVDIDGYVMTLPRSIYLKDKQ